MDVYTPFGAKASKYGNPANDVGVTTLYGVGDVRSLLGDLCIRLKEEHSITPPYLTKELKPAERLFFRLLFAERIYRKIYRLFEFERV